MGKKYDLALEIVHIIDVARKKKIADKIAVMKIAEMIENYACNKVKEFKEKSKVQDEKIVTR